MGEYGIRLCRVIASEGLNIVNNWGAFRSAVLTDLRNVISYGFQSGEVILIGMTPAFVAVRLRQPRPVIRSLLHQPGFTAALAMIFGLFWGTGALLSAFPEQVDSFTAAPIAVGASVFLTWAALALSRNWRSEPGWIDLVGKILGCTAIATAVMAALAYRI